MTGPLGAVALVGLAYLIGAIPFGILAGRLAGGVDLREHGSRRTGTTNALRTLGLGWAVAVFVLDVAKGAVAVLLAQALYQAGPAGISRSGSPRQPAWRRSSATTGRSSSASAVDGAWQPLPAGCWSSRRGPWR